MKWRLFCAVAALLAVATVQAAPTGMTLPSYEELIAKYGAAARGEEEAPPSWSAAVAAGAAAAGEEEEGDALIQTGMTTRLPQGACEVCVYVVENKQMRQPFLCRGLKDPAYQQTCVSVLVSMMWWLENEVYWLNYGCQRSSESNSWSWVKPCPAHAVCSWMENLYDRQPFCPPDAHFKKPTS
eukprot:PLAT1500.1.p1 GENE.PLAT1500.1~~PLAT1500.1.p1  ORF type:complete len:183 (+),score=55.69 PLAT1500.1:64-612(+)